MTLRSSSIKNKVYNILTENGQFVVKSVDYTGYPSYSVLAGQPIIRFEDSFDSLDDAKAAYPMADTSHELIMPQNTFDHLPDDSDY
jgi:hypothetical protein